LCESREPASATIAQRRWPLHQDGADESDRSDGQSDGAQGVPTGGGFASENSFSAKARSPATMRRQIRPCF
jgi:hypothetical protein